MFQTLKALLMFSTTLFTIIGSCSYKSIPQSEKNFKNFLNNSSLDSFVLDDEVRKLISPLNNHQALGPTCISKISSVRFVLF